MLRIWRWLFFVLVARPFAALALGRNVRHPERLPREGPALLVANHNSHLDTLMLMTLFPSRLLPRLRPVAAAEYFFRTRVLAWFALRIVGIIPVERAPRAEHAHPLAPCVEALDRGDILILFPEGTRGEPELRGELKSGIAHLVRTRPRVPVIPVFLRGAGRALPRGEGLFVPCICDIVVGEAAAWSGDKAAFMADLERTFQSLAAEIAVSGYDDGVEDEEDGDDETTL